MQRKSLLAVASTLLLLAIAGMPHRAQAFDFQISKPAVHDNLSVQFVRGGNPGAPSVLTLDQALARGAVKIFDDPQFAIQNLSGQSVFVQLGDLIRGGIQDQVIARSFILPPRSGRVPLGTYCVDPFRSSPRTNESATSYSATGAQFPWRLAKLSLLSGAADSKAIREIRQSGIWWSIDSVRTRLAQQIGVAMEPPKAVHWRESDIQNERPNSVLRSRHSAWITSLPLALENRRLAQAQQPYMDALKAAGEKGGNIIGVVFAVNGRIEGAEIYHSHALFRDLWAKLLRAYATQAIASKGSASLEPPAIEAVKAFLAAAEQGTARDSTSGSEFVVRDSDAAIYAETLGRDGKWISRSYVPKLDAAAVQIEPEAAIVKILETGRGAGLSLTSLGDMELLASRSNFASRDSLPAVWSANERSNVAAVQTGRADHAVLLLAAFLMAVAFVVFLFYRIARSPMPRPIAALRRAHSIVRAACAGAAFAQAESAFKGAAGVPSHSPAPAVLLERRSDEPAIVRKIETVGRSGPAIVKLRKTQSPAGGESAHEPQFLRRAA